MMNRTLATRVESVGLLMESWFDDGIDPNPVAALDWLGHVLEHLVGAFKLPVPYLYAMPHGHVRAGWATARWDVIADIDLTTHAAAVFARKVSTLEVHERRLELEAPGAEAQLGRFVAGHTK